MMASEWGKFPYFFFILLTQWHEFSAPKLTNFLIFIILLPLNVILFSKSSYLIAHIKINYERFHLKVFWKSTEMHPGPLRQLRWSSLRHKEPLINFTKNPNIGAMGILNASIEYYNVFWKLCRWLRLQLYLMPYELKYSTASNLDSSCVSGKSSYLAKQICLHLNSLIHTEALVLFLLLCKTILLK